MPDELKRLTVSYSPYVFGGGSESELLSGLLGAIRSVHSTFEPRVHEHKLHYISGELPESKVGKVLGLEGITSVSLDQNGDEWYARIIEVYPHLEAECRGKTIWIDPVTGDFEIGSGIEPIENLADRVGQVAERFYSRSVGHSERF